MRVYDPRIGRFLSEDPITRDYPELTPYQYASNNPVWNIDIDGLEGWEITSEDARLKKRVDDAMRRLNKAQLDGTLEGMAAQAHRNNNKATLDQGGYLGSKEYKVTKANWDTYGQYLPGPSDIVDGVEAMDELSKGNYKSAALAAFFLIPGTDVFKPIKSLKGTGGELLEGYVDKFGKQSKHLTKSDITGALKDIAGNPVVINGKTYNHLKEVEDALSGVGNQLDKLTKDINSGKFTDEVLKQAETIRGTLQKQKDKITDVLNEAKKNANK